LKCLCAFLDGQGLSSLRRTLQHEAFHQFADLVFESRLPPWLNEGLAQLFEEGIWTGQGFLLGQVPPWRVRQLAADLHGELDGHLIPFSELMNRTHPEWNKVLNFNPRGGATEYTQSWAMVHFLVNAKDAAGREKFRQMFLQMLDLLHDGKTPDEAFAGAFPGGNVKGFQDRFVEFARDLKPTPEAAMIERQEVLGDLLILLRQHGRTYRQVSDFRRDAVRILAKMLTYTGEHGLTWKTDPDAESYFKDVHDRPLADRELYFEAAEGAPLPDLVCRGAERFQLRTRFSRTDGKRVQRDVSVEPYGR
jgi:hypothetical protein